MKTFITLFTAIMLAFSGSLSAAGKSRGEKNPRHTVHVYHGKKTPYMSVSYPTPHYKTILGKTHGKTPYWSNRELETRYIYFPKMDMYYDSFTGAFIYTDEEAWIASGLVTQEYSLLRLKKAEQIQVNTLPELPKAYLEFYGTRTKHS